MGRAAGVLFVMIGAFFFLPFEIGLLPAGSRARATAASLSSDTLRTDLSDYLWPTDAGTIVTSTFGEYRSMHFHGGIDVSTGDDVGFRVFASRDGYVSRIYISPNGYGKMLFVRHRDGYTTVYAHLDGFAPAISARAVREQQRLERYPIDLVPGPGEFPVRKGEVVAFTGETGVGTPHLHFEIRDENMDAINPQLAEQLRIPDGIPPSISKVAIAPLGERTRVHGGWETQVYHVRPDGPGRYRIGETIYVTGRAGFAVSVRDRTEGTRFQRGVYRNTLYIDGREIYSARLERAPMNNAHEIGLYYDWGLLDRGLGRFERLYAEDASPHPFRFTGTPDRGIINSAHYPEGRHSFRIVCEDFFGNSSEVNGSVVFNHPPSFLVESAGPELALRFTNMTSLDRILVSTARDGVNGWSLHTVYPQRRNDGNLVQVPLPSGNFDVIKIVAQNVWGTKSTPQFHFVRKPPFRGQNVDLEHEVENGFVRVVARTSGMFTAPPSVVIYEGMERRAVSMEPTDVDTYVGSFTPSDSFAGLRRLTADAEVNGRHVTAFDEFALYPIIPGRSGSFSLDKGKLLLAYDSLTAYSTVYMEVEKDEEEGETAYSLLPLRTVLRGTLRVSVVGPASVQGQGLYFRGRSSRELLASRPSGPGGLYTGKISRTLGELYLAVDDSPPSVGRLQVAARSGRPTVSFRVSDGGSGIEYNELKMYIDENVAIPEIDGEHRRVHYQASDPLERGSHLLTIRLKDRAGNSSSVERRFFVR